jgi:hypothetical protein
MAEQPHAAFQRGKAEGTGDRRTPSERPDVTAGHRSPDDRDDFGRAALYTPRRYEQPIEDDDDPVMPSDDATVNTKI